MEIYQDEVYKSGLLADGVHHMRVLGSVGRREHTQQSDMDIWLVCQQDSTQKMKDIHGVVQKEMLIRHALSKSLGMPHLARHFASVFTEEEALRYQQAFPVRVAIPGNLGEHVIIGERGNTSINPDISTEGLEEDVAVSLLEFIGNCQKAALHNSPVNLQKWRRRIMQELQTYRDRERIGSNAEIDSLIAQTYQNDDQLFDDTRMFVDSLNVAPERITSRHIAHRLMWTLEKVRWELVAGYNDAERLKNWRLHSDRYLGLFPREISDLIIDFVGHTGMIPPNTTQLGSELLTLTRTEFDSQRLDHFHQLLSQWLMQAHTAVLEPEKYGPTEPANYSFILPRRINNVDVVTRVAVEQGKRFVISENVAIHILQGSPEESEHYPDERGAYLTDVEDYLGQPITDKELEKHLEDYAREFQKIHAHPVEKFGRLGTDYLVNSYAEYVQQRLDDDRIPADLRERLNLLVEMHWAELVQVKPVLCHMDGGPRNVVLDTIGQPKVVDFEHASGCAKEWDIERILFQLPSELRLAFWKSYYSDASQEYNPRISYISRLVMLATFACALSEKDEILKERCYVYVKNQLDAGKLLHDVFDMRTLEHEAWTIYTSAPSVKI